MTGLVAANLLYGLLGAGLLPLLRIAPDRRALLTRLPLAYPVGIAAAGILSAHLALLDVPVGFPELTLVTAAACALGIRRYRRLPRTGRPRPHALVALVPSLLVFLLAARAYAVRPLYEWDGWAIWGMKAKALYDLGGTGNDVFTTYPPLQHPLFLPSLEAVGFRAMGRFDGTLIHLQLAFLALAFTAGLWALLRPRVPAVAAGLAILAIVGSASVVKQLSTNLADVPLAFFVALGVVALARCADDADGWTLAPAALFLGAATLTKPEGLLFASAALVAAGAVIRTRAILWTAIGVAAIYAPWRIFLSAHGLTNPEYGLSDLLHPGYLADRVDRLSPALTALWHQLWRGDWGFLFPLVLLALVAAIVARRSRAAAFAASWLLLSFGGLVLIYWISVVPIQLTLTWTAERVVCSLLIGGAALAPLLAADSARDALVGAERRLLRARRREEPGLPAER